MDYVVNKYKNIRDIFNRIDDISLTYKVTKFNIIFKDDDDYYDFKKDAGMNSDFVYRGEDKSAESFLYKDVMDINIKRG